MSVEAAAVGGSAVRRRHLPQPAPIRSAAPAPLTPCRDRAARGKTVEMLSRRARAPAEESSGAGSGSASSSSLAAGSSCRPSCAAGALVGGRRPRSSAMRSGTLRFSSSPRHAPDPPHAAATARRWHRAVAVATTRGRVVGGRAARW